MDDEARRAPPAQVAAITRGAVMARVDEVPVGTEDRMSSVMTLDPLDAVDLREGETAHVMAEAVDVLLTRG